MMLLTLIFMALGAPETTLEIDGPFLKPTVHWQDLNGDGHIDIWIGDVTDQIWVLDRSKPNQTFQKLTYDRINGKEKPIWRDNQWRIGTFDQDSFLTFDPETGWQVGLDYTSLGDFREGFQPKNQGQQTLVPALDGYWLTEGSCVRKHFKVLPAINLKGSRLRVTYPILQWRDLNQDGTADLFAPPVSYQQQGYMGLWSAVQTSSGWEERNVKLQLSPELQIQQFQLGDVNGDSFQDLIVIAQPSKDMSVFEELSFLVYLASDHGVWESVASQTLKTRQNLWQTGPMEVNQNGIFIYYYKGLIRSKFKIDRYVWNEGGYIEPKPISAKWKVPDAQRDFIFLGYDFNGDGLKDLLLDGENGLQIHYRQKVSGKSLPFSEENKAQFHNQNFSFSNSSMSFSIHGDGTTLVQHPSKMRKSLRREKRYALIQEPEGYQFWHFEIDDHGKMTLYQTPTSIQ